MRRPRRAPTPGGTGLARSQLHPRSPGGPCPVSCLLRGSGDTQPGAPPSSGADERAGAHLGLSGLFLFVSLPRGGPGSVLGRRRGPEAAPRTPHPEPCRSHGRLPRVCFSAGLADTEGASTRSCVPASTCPAARHPGSSFRVLRGRHGPSLAGGEAAAGDRRGRGPRGVPRWGPKAPRKHSRGESSISACVSSRISVSNWVFCHLCFSAKSPPFALGWLGGHLWVFPRLRGEQGPHVTENEP